jgi:hypothetical protein
MPLPSAGSSAPGSSRGAANTRWWISFSFANQQTIPRPALAASCAIVNPYAPSGIAAAAARRDGLDAGGALTKIRRVLPDGVRLRVEALERTLRFTGPWREPAAPGGRDAAAARRRRAARPARARALHERGVPPPPGFDSIEFVSRTLARAPWAHAVEVLLHAPLDDAVRRFPPTLVELEPAGDDTLLRMRADSLDWVAELLAGARCDFTVREPDDLRALAGRLARSA